MKFGSTVPQAYQEEISRYIAKICENHSDHPVDNVESAGGDGACDSSSSSAFIFLFYFLGLVFCCRRFIAPQLSHIVVSIVTAGGDETDLQAREIKFELGSSFFEEKQVPMPVHVSSGARMHHHIEKRVSF